MLSSGSSPSGTLRLCGTLREKVIIADFTLKEIPISASVALKNPMRREKMSTLSPAQSTNFSMNTPEQVPLPANPGLPKELTWAPEAWNLNKLGRLKEFLDLQPQQMRQIGELNVTWFSEKSGALSLAEKLSKNSCHFQGIEVIRIYQEFNKEALPFFIDALGKLNYLRDLRLYNVRSFCESQLRNLADTFKSNEGLKSTLQLLAVSGCNATTAAASTLVVSLKGFTHLHCLDLSENQIDDDILTALNDAIKSMMTS